MGAHWALNKDVPPYMIDRITMPSWPTWSKYDFACLGLRPHLMLKLVRKPQPQGDGPHSFSDLFSTVIVENPDAYPWLGRSNRKGEGAEPFDVRKDDLHADINEVDLRDDGLDDDFGANGLPAHLDVDPGDLFFRPGDKVVTGCKEEDLPDLDTEDLSVPMDTGFVAPVDFELVDEPATVDSISIGRATNSKFVNVKLVKKHLWDLISEDIKEAEVEGKRSRSVYQALLHRLMDRIPEIETENLGVAVCFICILHLCNEKNLELDPGAALEEFAVLGPA